MPLAVPLLCHSTVPTLKCSAPRTHSTPESSESCVRRIQVSKSECHKRFAATAGRQQQHALRARLRASRTVAPRVRSPSSAVPSVVPSDAHISKPVAESLAAKKMNVPQLIKPWEVARARASSVKADAVERRAAIVAWAQEPRLPAATSPQRPG